MSDFRGLSVGRGRSRGGLGHHSPSLPPREASDSEVIEKRKGAFNIEFKETAEEPLAPLKEVSHHSCPFLTSSVNEPAEIPVSNFDEIDATDVEKKIIRQMEFYFGDFNLPRDKFMMEIMYHEDGWISMSVMMTFKRLAALTDDPFLVMTAVEKSPNKIIEVDRSFVDPDTGTVGRLRRNPSKPAPEFSDARRKFIEERTVFVAGFPQTGITLDQIIEFFESSFEHVGNVRMRYSRRFSDDKDESAKFLGSVFVSFYTKEAARQFVHDHGDNLRFFSWKLFVKWQSDFIVEKPEYNDFFYPDAIDRTVFVSGFDNRDTSLGQLTTFFSQFDGTESVDKRNFRERRDGQWKFTGTVFVTFEDRERAEQFMGLPEVTFNGDKLNRKWQLQFYEDRGLFRREIQNWKRTVDAI